MSGPTSTALDRLLRVELQWGIKIPLRDGTKLNATLYLPEGRHAPAPTIFDLTPYTGNRLHPRASMIAHHGFPVLIVDARGRANSEGTFTPFVQEAKDGFDIVEWIAGQRFCNGKVAMFGGSYEGCDQWATAKERPPHLATIVPFVASAPGLEFPMRNNIGYPYAMRWIAATSGRTQQEGIFADQQFWRGQYYKWHTSGRPFRHLDQMLGNPSTTFQTWVSHPALDSYWDACLPTAEEYARLDLPILSVTGAYDSGQVGALHQYRQHNLYATPEARAKHFLVLGPWDHRGPWNGNLGLPPVVGGVTFGPASLIDAVRLHTQWYNWLMCDGPQPDLLQRRVAYYVAGREQWRYTDTLEEITASLKPLYLDSKGTASRIFDSGLLRETAGSGSGDTYIYDPRDRSIAEVELPLEEPFTIMRPVFPTDDPTDQTLVYAKEGKALFYHSAPFPRDTQITGFFRLTAWVSIDQPDTDFVVTIYEITPDGGSILLGCDQMRARYRESLRKETLVKGTEPLCFDFNRFTFTSREVKAGSRLRLVIGPIDSMYFQRNCNTGGVVADESIDDARPVKVTVWHDTSHPSVLHVPYGRPVSANEPTAPPAAFVKPAS